MVFLAHAARKRGKEPIVELHNFVPAAPVVCQGNKSRHPLQAREFIRRTLPQFGASDQIQKFFGIRPPPSVDALLAVAHQHGPSTRLAAGQGMLHQRP